MSDLQRYANDLRDNEALEKVIDRLKLDLLEQFGSTPAEKLGDLQKEYQWLDQLRNRILAKIDLLETT